MSSVKGTRHKKIEGRTLGRAQEGVLALCTAGPGPQVETHVGELGTTVAAAVLDLAELEPGRRLARAASDRDMPSWAAIYVARFSTAVHYIAAYQAAEPRKPWDLWLGRYFHPYGGEVDPHRSRPA